MMLANEKLLREKRIIEFKVKFITPLLIGGGSQQIDPKGKSLWKLDNDGLTGKALRGCWRFWFRAILGGVVKEDIQIEKLKYYESKIFGSADSAFGPKFKMQIEVQNKIKSEVFSLGFEKRNRKGEYLAKEGYPVGTEYLIKIFPLKEMSNNEKNLEVLLATIWVWGNLGGIGLRARRGFGSPAIYCEVNKNPFNDLPLQQGFDSHADLEKHLRSGFRLVQNKFKNLIETDPDSLLVNPHIKDYNSSHCNPYFILRSLEQIYVGNGGWSDLNEAIKQVHGSSHNNSLGWIFSEKFDGLNARMASPIIFRFHKINNLFYPVFTYCEPFCYPQQIGYGWKLNKDCRYIQTEFPKYMANFISNKKIDHNNVFVKSLKEDCDESRHK